MKRLTILVLAAAPFLSACMQVPQMAPAAAVQPVPMIEPVAPVAGVAGLQEREPDLCGADRFAAYLGQPGTIVPSLGITTAYNVVEYRGIEPQDYNPKRVVFRLDAGGNIYNVDCG